MSNSGVTSLSKVLSLASPIPLKILLDVVVPIGLYALGQYKDGERAEEVDADLEVILSAIQRLDQALIDSQEGKDIQLARLERLREALFAQN
ncbi:MAG: hypothetical protein R3261_13075, partial [Alphaproteobacteria bacterium]|nr:hypothetical protein [Alphaproteobacteria bacterium]